MNLLNYLNMNKNILLKLQLIKRKKRKFVKKKINKDLMMILHQIVVVVMKILKHLFLLKIVQQRMIINQLISYINKVFLFIYFTVINRLKIFRRGCSMFWSYRFKYSLYIKKYAQTTSFTIRKYSKYFNLYI
jgi:hypothetical protein